MVGEGRPSTPAPLNILADRAGGLRFPDGGVRLPLPGGVAIELLGGALRDRGPALAVVHGLAPRPAGDGDGRRRRCASFRSRSTAAGSGWTPTRSRPPCPRGMGIDLALPPVSGGGFLREKDKQYGGILDLDLGVFQVQAIGLLTLPDGDRDLSFLVLLSGALPAAGDPARVRVRARRRRRAGRDQPPCRRRTAARPGRRGQRRPRDVPGAGPRPRRRDPATPSTTSFPAAPGHHVIGPMLQINWGGRLVTRLGGRASRAARPGARRSCSAAPWSPFPTRPCR